MSAMAATMVSASSPRPNLYLCATELPDAEDDDGPTVVALDQARLAARFGELRILVRGESGAGKSAVAEAYAKAAKLRLIQINCALLVPERAAADLFGHVRGAFTGAVKATNGLVGDADGGVLWLDEVHRLPLDAQGLLLTWLDTGQYRPVGSTELRYLACPLICSTNADLRAMAADGTFAHDLLHRIANVELKVPPLRDRPETSAEVAEAAAERLGLALSPGAMAWVESGEWEWDEVPGNARRLQNAVWQAGLAALERHSRVIQATDFGGPPVLDAGSQEALEIVRANPGISTNDLAEALGVHRNTARRRAEVAGCTKFAGERGGWFTEEPPALQIVRANPGIRTEEVAAALGLSLSMTCRRIKACGCVKRHGRKGGWWAP